MERWDTGEWCSPVLTHTCFFFSIAECIILRDCSVLSALMAAQRVKSVKNKEGLESHNSLGSLLTICYHQHLLLLDSQAHRFVLMSRHIVDVSTSYAVAKTAHKERDSEKQLRVPC